MQQQGAVILDTQRRILVLTPVAEDILGWRNDQVMGMGCSLVFNCQDAAGHPMCGECGFEKALEGQEITPSTPVQIADPFGGRQGVKMSFWYLPPAGSIAHPRLLAVLDAPAAPLEIEEAS
jgi:hypothetical protein